MKFSFTYPYILYSSALAIKAKIMVELGTGTGMSTEALTEVAKITDGLLYSIDIAKCEETRNRLQNKHLVFLMGDSIEIGKQWDKRTGE